MTFKEHLIKWKRKWNHPILIKSIRIINCTFHTFLIIATIIHCLCLNLYLSHKLLKELILQKLLFGKCFHFLKLIKMSINLVGNSKKKLNLKVFGWVLLFCFVRLEYSSLIWIFIAICVVLHSNWESHSDNHARLFNLMVSWQPTLIRRGQSESNFNQYTDHHKP